MPTMQRVITTVEKQKVIHFLTELELFLRTYLLELSDECSASMHIQNLKKALGESKLNFFLCTICMQQFMLHVRNCIRMRASLLGNSQVEESRIHISQWPAIKKEISNETPKETLLSIASKMSDESFNHLAEIQLTLSCEEVKKKVRKSIAEKKPPLRKIAITSR